MGLATLRRHYNEERGKPQPKAVETDTMNKIPRPEDVVKSTVRLPPPPSKPSK